MHRFDTQRSPVAAASRRRITVYDRRSDARTSEPKVLETAELDFNGFHRLLRRTFSINESEVYELVTTDRIIVDFVKFNESQDGSTLYLVRNRHQQLPGATEELISYTPHYHTLTEAGTYEYYTSEGNRALPGALAELIDNALSATSKNKGVKTIEIRMMFDGNIGKPALIVMDNGCGMTTKKLKNWAVYKLSKFTREECTFSSQEERYVRPDPVPRFLNSDISYFGVGGKQAIFFIGNSVRMITKSTDSPDIHELILSEEEFKRKEANKEDIFSGYIRNRAPGESSHVTESDERFLHKLIAEERGKESFTAVIITGLHQHHIDFIRKKFDVLTRELAHIYHYYIHGKNGNDLRRESTWSDQHNKLDILVTLREKPPKCPSAINLREVDNDMQTLYINSAVDTFEFRASTVPDGAKLEGLVRYHPFLFDRETYPQEPNIKLLMKMILRMIKRILEEERKKSLHVSGMDASYPAPKCLSSIGALGPVKDQMGHLYNRLSGVLFTDDGFKVTQNKLTFMDLGEKVKNKETLFTIVSHGQNTPRRADIKSQFNQWLLKCHKQYDKQVEFMGCKETVERLNERKKAMETWTPFSAIKWGDRIFKAGDKVKSYRKQPVIYGTVVHFLLQGKHNNDVFGAGGLVEVIREPKALYDETKTICISKIDKNATDNAIATNINNDLLKVPKELKLEWPEGNSWSNNSVWSAGSVLGPLKVTILNGKGEPISVIPSGRKTTMNVTFSLVHHSPGGKQTKYTAQHSSSHGFWFKKIEMVHLGKYTLSLNAIVSESRSTVFGGTNLPSYKLKFAITAGVAETFTMDEKIASVRVGVPFDIPLQMADSYGHEAEPPFQLQPVLTCSDLKLSYTSVDSKKSTVTIRGVKATGKVLNQQEMKIKVTLPGLKKDTQSKKINLRPGLPHSIYVTPKEDPISVENGTPVTFNVEVHDEAGNVTANPRQTVRCRVPGSPQQTTECSTAGVGQLLTKPINLKIINREPQTLQVSFEMPTHKAVNPVTRDLLVLPSTRVAAIELRVNNDENLLLKPNEKIKWLAGGLLENLFYKLFDEAGREVTLTDQIASKIKVNWTDVNMKDLVQGKLPVIHVAKQVQDERFYLVSYQEQSFSFMIIPHPDEPNKLKVTLPQSTVKLGETLSADIRLELVDKYDNATKSLTSTCLSQMNVEAEGLDKSAVTFAYQESSSSVAVTGVRFEGGTLGPREMSFTYQSYVEQVIVKVTPGVPAKLTLLSAPVQPLQFLNGTGNSTPFVVQLSDKWGNPSDDQTVEVKITSSPPGLTVTTSGNSYHLNAEGKASFIVDSISGPKGYYQLTFEGSFNNSLISSPSVNLTVIPDPNKPVKLLVEYDKTAKLPAGRSFPDFSVTVVSDEGSPITTFEPSAVSMLLWNSESSGNAPPGDATVMMCNMPLKNDRNDRFYFREKEIPTLLGGYIIQFSLRITDDELLFSDQIPVLVVSDQPIKLGPGSPLPNPVVSCSEDIANRTLVENMILMIMDMHGNPAGQNLNGKVVVSIISAHGERKHDLPLFEGNNNTMQFDVVQGKAHIHRLAIMKNSPGENGSTYILLFKPEVVSTSLAPYKLHFDFYSDVQKQQMVLKLNNKKAELTTALDSYDELFSTFTELLNMLTLHRDAASQKEAKVRDELKKKKIAIPQPVSISTVDTLISGKTAEAENIERMQRRTCNISDHFKGRQDVLGKVGHLAQVQDDNAARVISWTLAGNLDCVVTKTTEAAQEIYRDTRGQQQVLPLDSIHASQANRPLPHIQRGRALFDPPGNPVLARELLIYPQHEESCKIVFQNLLGDTILINDLDSANEYRRKVVQNRIPCSTILTRQGERVSAKGIFGGAQNKAPPMNRLKLFAAPLPETYHTLVEQKELLSQYRSVLQQKEDAERQRQEQLDKGGEIERQKLEMNEKIKQLEEIDSQLASLQARPARRSLPHAPGSSGIAAKRAKM